MIDVHLQRQLSDFRQLLSEVITPEAASQVTAEGKNAFTSWSEAKRLLRSDARYSKLSSKDCESLWRQYVEDMARKIKNVIGDLKKEKSERDSGMDSKEREKPEREHRRDSPERERSDKDYRKDAKERERSDKDYKRDSKEGERSDRDHKRDSKERERSDRDYRRDLKKRSERDYRRDRKENERSDRDYRRGHGYIDYSKRR